MGDIHEAATIKVYSDILDACLIPESVKHSLAQTLEAGETASLCQKSKKIVIPTT